ncbi:MAG: hypothetical protein DRJ15_15700 [Bacteroidetes bacterium]|nr:MAG: hypothetical protein DRJ15_15700 [Bacteroidota bacterium]
MPKDTIMNQEEQIEAVELSIKQAEMHITTMESLEKLTKNEDFTSIILDGYFKEEASRLVLIKAEPSMQGVEDQAQITKSIDSIGYLRQYFSTIMNLGRMADKAVIDHKETHAELLAGEV